MDWWALEVLLPGRWMNRLTLRARVIVDGAQETTKVVQIAGQKVRIDGSSLRGIFEVRIS